jgi:hypothetical protein
MNLFKQSRSTANPEHLQQLKRWISDFLDLPQDVTVSISQLQCHEPGCPPIETVIAIMTQPPHTCKIHAAPGDITQEMLTQALRQNVHE